MHEDHAEQEHRKNMTTAAANPALLASRSGARAIVECTHCTLPVPAGLVEDGAESQFCCQGCRTAYDIIHSGGLDRYYALREGALATGAITGDTGVPSADPMGPRRPVRASASRFTEFDDAKFAAIYCRKGCAGTLSADLMLEGVHCAACVWLIERLPRLVPGIVEARLDVRRSVARLTWDPARVSLSRAASVLDSLGYTPHPARGVTARSVRVNEDRRHVIRLAVAGACAGNAMLLAMALYAGMFDGIEAAYKTLFEWTSVLIGMVSLLWPGRVFLRSAWAAIRTRTMNLDLPISLGLVAGALWSIVAAIRGTGEVYFDSLSVLVFLLLVGRFIQHRQQRWAGDAVEMLFALTPTSARVVRDGEIVVVPVESLAAGDHFEVRAGETFAADGVITEGSSKVDASLLTGESKPVSANAGDRVAAGSVNVSARVMVRAEATGEDTRVGRLMKLVQESAERKAPIVRLADKAAGWFVAGMLAASAVTFLIWVGRDVHAAVNNAAALLIVTCPCALGLATPLVLTVALGRAARRGIMIKGGDAIERLSKAGELLLDKTGTVTEGRTALVEWTGDSEALALAAELERQSSHPVARALAAAGRDLAPAGAELAAGVADVTETPGFGIEGTVGGLWVVVGSPAFAEKTLGADVAEIARPAETAFAAAGLTPVVIAVAGKVRGVAGLGDPVREDAAGSIAAMTAAGWKVGILSGDHPGVVRSVAGGVGLSPLDARGGASPEDKLARVRDAVEREERGRPIVMVGDGVNDAAALAAASAGIAVHGGAEASLAAADVYINTPGLTPLVELLSASRRTMRTIRVTLGVSILYNVLAAVLSATGNINPLVAAILMPASSLTVLTIAYRARTFSKWPMGHRVNWPNARGGVVRGGAAGVGAVQAAV
jgi:Cu2+-exporting ATPase